MEDGFEPMLNNFTKRRRLVVLLGSRYPEQDADRERNIRVLRGLPADIWVTCHARWWGRYRKFVASTTAKNPVDAFVDPEGYRAYIDAAEAELRDYAARQDATPSTSLGSLADALRDALKGR